MKAVFQNVIHASVREGDCLICKIGKGIVIYLGVGIEESESNVEWLIDQINKRKSQEDEVLILSQFTIFASFKSGKPSFHRAERPFEAEKYFYNSVCKIKNAFPKKVQNGIFGKKLLISLDFETPNAEFLEI